MRESTRGAVRLSTAAGAGLLLAAIAGCGQMGAALSKQWMTVDFNPGTSMATALHVRAACSHIHSAPPIALPAKHSVINIMYGVQYDTTKSSLADLARLQTCLLKFNSVAGVNPQTAGDEGS